MSTTEPVYPVVFGTDPFPPAGTEYTPPQFAPDEKTMKQMISSDDDGETTENEKE